jgi:hypothetical protein
MTVPAPSRSRPPNRLDTWFGVVAGAYVAGVLSPALLSVAVWRLDLESAPFVLGSLVLVGAVLTALVALAVTRRSSLVAWFDSTWVALLVPAVGLVPTVAYFVPMARFLGASIAHVELPTAVPLVGFAGFFLGLAACLLGAALTLMARSRRADEAVDEAAVELEWTAGWPRRARLKFMGVVLLALWAMYGAVAWRYGLVDASPLLQFAFVVVMGARSTVSERTYRVTSAGLELRRDGWVHVSWRFIPWSSLEGFSVTDDGVVLHRRLPYPDLRCARWDVILSTDIDSVADALDPYLDRRDP